MLLFESIIIVVVIDCSERMTSEVVQGSTERAAANPAALAHFRHQRHLL